MYRLELKRSVDKKFRKLESRDRKQLQVISRKIEKIISDPYRFKPLRKPLHGFRRVHIDKSFVLIYTIDELTKTVIIYDYEHHDKVYRKP